MSNDLAGTESPGGPGPQGEKVDYAILVDGAPVSLVEAKAATAPLVVEAETQLYRYFTATGARFAILTNGVRYKFFSDLTEPNKMDKESFLEFDLMDIKEPVVPELKKFCRASLNVKELSETAVVLKYENRLRKMLEKELREPGDDFSGFGSNASTRARSQPGCLNASGPS